MVHSQIHQTISEACDPCDKRSETPKKVWQHIFFLCSISIRIWLTIKSAWLLVVLVSAGQMLKSPQQSFDKKNKTAYHWRKEETGNGASINQFCYHALSEQIWSNLKSTTLEQYVVQQMVGCNIFQLSSTFHSDFPNSTGSLTGSVTSCF